VCSVLSTLTYWLVTYLLGGFNETQAVVINFFILFLCFDLTTSIKKINVYRGDFIVESMKSEIS